MSDAKASVRSTTASFGRWINPYRESSPYLSLLLVLVLGLLDLEFEEVLPLELLVEEELLHVLLLRQEQVVPRHLVLHLQVLRVHLRTCSANL